ncbi:MAG: hypothetical protein SOW30_02725 [Parabacteroides sp.]|nr:hypothetical protein [Parabacteroides sp.]
MNQSIEDLVRELWKSGDRESAILALEKEGAKGDYEAYDLLTLLTMPLVQSKGDYEQVVEYIQKGAAYGSLECQVVLYMLDHPDSERAMQVNDETADFMIRALDKGSQAALSFLYCDSSRDPEIWIPYLKRIFETLETTKASFPVAVDEAICGLVITAYTYNRHDRDFVKRVLDYLTPLANRGYVDSIVAFLNIYIFHNFDHMEYEQLAAWADMIVDEEPGYCYFFHGLLCFKQDDCAGAALNWKQASEHHFDEATVYYAHLLMRGAGVPQDMDTAAKLLEPLVNTDIHAARGLAYIAMFKDKEYPNLSEAICILETYQNKLPYTVRQDILLYVMYAYEKGIESDHPYRNQLSELLDRYKEEGFDFTGLRWYAIWHRWIQAECTIRDMAVSLAEKLQDYTLDCVGGLLLSHLLAPQKPEFAWTTLGALSAHPFFSQEFRYATAIGAFKYAEDDHKVESQKLFLQMAELLADRIGDYKLQTDVHYYKYCHQFFDQGKEIEYCDPQVSDFLNYANNVSISYIYYYINARLTLNSISEMKKDEIIHDMNLYVREPMFSFHWYTMARINELLDQVPEGVFDENASVWYREEYPKNTELCVPYLDPEIVLKGLAASIDLI